MNKLLIGLLYLCFIPVFFSCTAKGEDDPWLSFRTRDNRLKNSWKLEQMENTFELTTITPGNNSPDQILISTSFDGTNLRLKSIVNNQVLIDTLFGYSFHLKIKDDGELSYQYVNFLGGLGIKSSGDDNWFWQSDDRKKSKVNLGQAMLKGVSAGYDLSLLSDYSLEHIFQSFNVTELRNDELKLRLDKRQTSSNLNGNIEEVKISHSSSFVND